MSDPRVGNLVVYVEEGRNDIQLSPTSTRYRIVEAIIHHALCLLETEEGKRSLAAVATEIIKERDTTAAKRRRPGEHIYRDSLNNMPFWIDRFLRRMRQNFPPTYITPKCHGEAAAQKNNWGDDMAEYDAGDSAGYLVVSDAIISNMTHVRQQPQKIARNSYDLFKFQMTVSVAHEIVHFLTGFITGDAVPHTPPGVSEKPYGGLTKGEAGRYWEVMFLGGILEFYSSPSDPLGPQQAGRPYLFAGGLEEKVGREVSMSYVEEFIEGVFTFPIRTSSKSDPVVRKRMAPSQETTKLRNSKDYRNATRLGSPDPDHINAGPDVRYRSIFVVPESGYSQTSYSQAGYSQGGYSQGGYSQASYSQTGYSQTGASSRRYYR